MTAFPEPGYTSTTAGDEAHGWVGSNRVAIASMPEWVCVSATPEAKSVGQTSQNSLKQENDALSQLGRKRKKTNQQLQSDLKVVPDKLNVHTDGPARARSKPRRFRSLRKKLTGLTNRCRSQWPRRPAATDGVSKLNGDVTSVRSGLDATPHPKNPNNSCKWLQRNGHVIARTTMRTIRGAAWASVTITSSRYTQSRITKRWGSVESKAARHKY